MPPLLPRPTLLPRGRPATIQSLSKALFSSTTTTSSAPQRIPPESPLFINIPNPPQDQSVENFRDLKRNKGHLPLPRQVFRKRDGHLKSSETWLTKSAPQPSSEASKQPPKSEVQAWKRKMAHTRRDNMREGVRALYARKKLFDSRRTEKQVAKLESHRAAATAPEREDERLTRASVNAGTLQTKVLPDPLRFERAEASKERSESIAARKSEARRDAIQELYMRARSFIVSENDLEAEVNRLFAPDYWKKMGMTASGFDVNNIWDLSGRPPTVADMLNEVSRTSSTVLKNLESEKTKTLKRQKEVAEELTGGKLDGI
ncbi:uncharacterized protein F4822DRAFT_392848 [Hypoxylon trugodes]|uniref:uncharacterized protein n=1 Tax=Hypoxylon trugodes TaxID=326681 RepID=UPI00219E0B33|nr:uncharacterized protein F4822DRAFT_392848 [Hypoxylon trugodes]KAI1393016.1 hypothetical protein F4822DRAFT_392848 [Hypoxylon trugodes]